MDEIDVCAIKDAFFVTPFGILITAYDLAKKALELTKLKKLSITQAATVLVNLARDWNNNSNERLAALMAISSVCPSINDLAEVISNPNESAAINQTASWLQP